MEEKMELHENRTELERLLAVVWEYEDGSRKKTSLPKWLFAITLTGAVICTFSSDVVAPVMIALPHSPEKLSLDNVSSENVTEYLDYHTARHTESLAGWRAFLEAHPEGPHAQAAHAEIERLLSAPQPAEVAAQSPPYPATTQTPVNAAQPPAPPAPPPVMVDNEPASPALPPVMVDKEPAPAPQPVEVAEQSPPSEEQSPLSLGPTQTSVNAAQPPAPSAPPPVMVDKEPARPVEVVASAPLPPLRSREIAAAKSAEPAHHSHWRAGHQGASQPNVFTVLVAQLFHGHRQHWDIMSNGWWR
jgi:hypothetical protein